MSFVALAGAIVFLQLLLVPLLVVQESKKKLLTVAEHVLVGAAAGIACCFAAVEPMFWETKNTVGVLLPCAVTVAIFVRRVIKERRPEERYFEEVVRRELERRR